MKFIDCQGCEKRRQWLNERAKESISSIQRAIAALSGTSTKQPDDEADAATESSGTETNDTGNAKPKRAARNNQQTDPSQS